MKAKNTVMVIDGGGRGSALVAKYSKSKYVGRVFVVPGNDLMSDVTTKPIKTFQSIKTTNINTIVKIAKKYHVDLVDVAQDDAVAAGLVNRLHKENIKVFGPTKEAGRIEWDKAWARNFMKKYNIPAPIYRIFKSEKEGIAFINKSKNAKWYVKASGLAGGKGALYAKDNLDAIEKIREMKHFGSSGKTFLVEQCLEGEEFSSFAIVNNTKFTIIAHAQDHKTVYNGDMGPNTGGMGCTSPPLVVTKKIENQIAQIVKKTVYGLVKENTPYQGILYIGSMLVGAKVYVIEFNARWGDPEAQAIIPAITNDYFDLVLEAQVGNMKKLSKDNQYRVVVTAAVSGYPRNYSQGIGKNIFGLGELKKSKDVTVYGAGVKKVKSKHLTNGGRLFYVLADGKNVIEARQKVYDALSKIYIEGNNLHYRTDIGYRDLERLNQ